MQTATNPQTGEKLVFQNGLWVPMGDAAPIAPPMAAPSALGAGITVGHAKPDYSARDQQIQEEKHRLAMEQANKPNLPAGYRMGANGVAERIPGLPGDKTETDPTLSAAIKNLSLEELLLSVSRAREQIDTGWATGIKGAAGGLIPGSTRNDFLGSLSSIQGGVIMEKLQALKEASKTGASGMGALSEKEGERLAASVAALNGNMSDEELSRSLNQIERHARTLQAVAEGKNPDSVNLMSGGGQLTPAGEGVEGRRLSPDDTAAYGQFLKTKPDAAGLNAWWEKRGFPGLKNADEVAKALKEGRAVDTGIDYSAVDSAAEVRAREELVRQDGRGMFGGDSAAGTLLNSGATLNLSDEASGVGMGLGYALTGKSPAEGYRLGRDTQKLRIANAREQLGGWGTGLEIAGGFLSANPTAALAPATSALATIGQGARAGAAGGALAGFGSGEGLEGKVRNTLLGAGAGAALGGAVSGISARLAPRGMNPELARASEAEGVDLLKPMVDPRKISEFGGLESNVYSQPVIRAASAKVREQIGDRVGSLGKGGDVLEAGAAGERLQAAGNRYITRSKGIATRLYDRASKLSGDTPVTPSKAVAQIDQELADLEALPNVNQGEIAFMQELKGDLTRGPLSVGTIRDLRTSIRGRIGTSNLTMTQAEARATRVMGAATDDVAAAVPPEAASAYRRADAFYRERQVMVDDIKRSILGKRDDPLDPQKAFANIKSLTSPSGNGRRLGAIMRHLEPDERQDIAATVAETLGKDGPDDPFSAAKFLTRTSNSKFSPSARRTIFGTDGAQAIDNLRLLSRKLVEAGADINRSRSATVLERQGMRTAARAVVSGLAGIGGTAAGGVSGGVAGLAVAGAAMGASAARRVLSARAMVSPRVSRWLAEAADVSTPAQAQTAIRKLGTVIAREPALAGELTPLQRELSQMLAPASAGDGEEDNSRGQ